MYKLNSVMVIEEGLRKNIQVDTFEGILLTKIVKKKMIFY